MIETVRDAKIGFVSSLDGFDADWSAHIAGSSRDGANQRAFSGLFDMTEAALTGLCAPRGNCAAVFSTSTQAATLYNYERVDQSDEVAARGTAEGCH